MEGCDQDDAEGWSSWADVGNDKTKLRRFRNAHPQAGRNDLQLALL